MGHAAIGQLGNTVIITLCGVRISIELGDPELADAVAERLPPGWMPSTDATGECARRYRIAQVAPRDPPERLLELLIDGSPAYRPGRAETILDLFESDLQLFVAEFADPLLFLHAGVVGWRGRAIVLPGSSHAGKSTLVAALVAAGATYYSDEYAVLDVRGRVYPFPRRLSLRPGPFGSGRVDLSHRTPRGAEAASPLPIGLVALVTYRPGQPWRAHRLDPPGAIMAMCQHTVAIRRRPLDTLAILKEVAGSAIVMAGTRGEADATAAWLLQQDWNEEASP